MAAPSIRAVGAVATGTANITPVIPSGSTTNDIMLAYVHSSNQTITGPGNGWVEVANSPQGTGTAATAGSVRLAVFWKRHSGTESNPTFTDTGDHTFAVIISVKDCVTSGDPWDVTAGNVDSTATAASSAVDATTTVADTFVLFAFAHARDSNTSPYAGEGGASNLTGPNIEVNSSSTSGTGGGFFISSGTKSSAGALAGTYQLLLSPTSKTGKHTIALKPVVTGSSGSSSGAATVSGTGSSTAASSAASAGIGAASGTGRATATGVGAAAASAAASATGVAQAQGTASASGVGAASATGASTATAAGSAAGIGAATGAASSTLQAAGSAAGVGAASGAGQSSALSAGSAAGAATAAASGLAQAQAAGSVAAGAAPLARLLEGFNSLSGTGPYTGDLAWTGDGAARSLTLAASPLTEGADSWRLQSTGAGTGIYRLGIDLSGLTHLKLDIDIDGIYALGYVYLQIMSLVTFEVVGDSTPDGLTGTYTLDADLGGFSDPSALANVMVTIGFGTQDSEGSATVDLYLDNLRGVYGGSVSATGASTATAAGSVAGIGAASGAAISTAAAAGSVAGAGSAAATGSSTATAAGSSAGTGTAAAAGSTLAPAVATAAGAATAAAAGRSNAAGAGSVAGIGAASGEGSSTAASAAAASGAGTASGSASSTAEGSASADGVSTASGAGAAQAAASGAADGIADVSATGHSIAFADGVAEGAASAQAEGIEGAQGQATGSSHGSASCTAASLAIWHAAGSAAGVATAAADGLRLSAGAGIAAGVAAAAATLEVIPTVILFGYAPSPDDVPGYYRREDLLQGARNLETTHSNR